MTTPLDALETDLDIAATRLDDDGWVHPEIVRVATMLLAEARRLEQEAIAWKHTAEIADGVAVRATATHDSLRAVLTEAQQERVGGLTVERLTELLREYGALVIQGREHDAEKQAAWLLARLREGPA